MRDVNMQVWLMIDSLVGFVGVGEEKALIRMFGDDYVRYRGRTSTWIPFLDGAVDRRVSGFIRGMLLPPPPFYGMSL